MRSASFISRRSHGDIPVYPITIGKQICTWTASPVLSMDFIGKNKQTHATVYIIHPSADRPLASPARCPAEKSPMRSSVATPRDQRGVTSIRVHASNAHATKKRVCCPFRQDHSKKSRHSYRFCHPGRFGWRSRASHVPTRVPGAHSSSRCPLEFQMPTRVHVSSPRPIRAGRPRPRRRRCCRLRRTMPPIAGRDYRGSLGGIVRPWLPWGRTDVRASVHPGR